MTTIINVNNFECGCDEWSCETCYPSNTAVKPKPVSNSWCNPLPYATVPQPLADALVTEDSEDAYWTTEVKNEVTEVTEDEGWQTVKKKKYRSKGGAGMKPIQIRCGCKQLFMYTVEQQQKYRARGWKQPRVCKKCSYERYNENN